MICMIICFITFFLKAFNYEIAIDTESLGAAGIMEISLETLFYVIIDGEFGNKGK